jgi:hypothetical protein
MEQRRAAIILAAGLVYNKHDVLKKFVKSGMRKRMIDDSQVDGCKCNMGF